MLQAQVLSLQRLSMPLQTSSLSQHGFVAFGQQQCSRRSAVQQCSRRIVARRCSAELDDSSTKSFELVVPWVSPKPMQLMAGDQRTLNTTLKAYGAAYMLEEGSNMVVTQFKAVKDAARYQACKASERVMMPQGKRVTLYLEGQDGQASVQRVYSIEGDKDMPEEFRRGVVEATVISLGGKDVAVPSNNAVLRKYRELQDGAIYSPANISPVKRLTGWQESMIAGNEHAVTEAAVKELGKHHDRVKPLRFRGEVWLRASRLGQIDAGAISDQCALIVQVKTRLLPVDVVQLTSSLDMVQEYHDLIPELSEFAGKRLMGAMAADALPDNEADKILLMQLLDRKGYSLFLRTGHDYGTQGSAPEFRAVSPSSCISS